MFDGRIYLTRDSLAFVDSRGSVRTPCFASRCADYFFGDECCPMVNTIVISPVELSMVSNLPARTVLELRALRRSYFFLSYNLRTKVL